MAPTRIRQDQIQDLESDLSSFESIDDSLEDRISLEESIDDSVEDSLEAKISQEESESDAADESLELLIDSMELVTGSTGSIQTQIDMLKTTLGNVIYPDPVMYQMGDTFYFAGTMQYPIPTTTEFKWYFADDMESRNFIEISGESGSTLTPTGEFANPSYGYYLEVTYTSDLGVFQKDSQHLIYAG
jgi:hypothetical protein